MEIHNSCERSHWNISNTFLGDGINLVSKFPMFTYTIDTYSGQEGYTNRVE